MLGRWIWPCLLLGCTACDLTEWLNEEPEADKGYHVLCVTDLVTVHVNGFVGCSTLELPLSAELPEKLEQQLKLRSRLRFHRDGRPVAWPKQSWAVFTTAGERWTPEQLVQKAAANRGAGGTWSSAALRGRRLALAQRAPGLRTAGAAGRRAAHGGGAAGAVRPGLQQRFGRSPGGAAGGEVGGGRLLEVRGAGWLGPEMLEDVEMAR
eukprot:Skav219950  [mRNA]  locus=scaffold2879:148030:149347:+ [translate_table: standard]